MRKQRTSEDWLAEVDAIIRRYRSGSKERAGEASMTEEEAIAQLRRLGVAYGEAVRWLTAGRSKGVMELR